MRIGLPHALQDRTSYTNGTVPAHDGGVQVQVHDSYKTLETVSFVLASI
jgi:hypothetical protein